MILVLSTLSSGTNFVVAESVPESFEPILKPKIFVINLIEEIGIKETKEQSEKYKKYNITLQEKISITNNNSVLRTISRLAALLAIY